MTRNIKIAVALYAVIGCATFGHAAAERERTDQAEYDACVMQKKSGYCFQENFGGIAGLAAAPLWPLYWSWEAWS